MLGLFSLRAYLDGAVEMPGEAILNEQSCEVENCQKQSFELSVVGAVAYQQP